MTIMSDGEDNDVINHSKFTIYKLNLANELKDPTKSIKKIWKYVNEHINDEEERKDIIEVCEGLDFIPLLLCNYDGSLSKKDKYIYDIINKLEENYNISLSKFMPFSFGEKGKGYYNNLQKLGTILHQRQTFSEALSQLDKNRMLFSIKTLSTPHELPEDAKRHIYDPRFMLRMFCTMLEPGSDLNCKSFITSYCLSYLFASTSIKDEDLRGLAYIGLQRFFIHSNQLTTDNFDTKRLVQQLIRLFKESVTVIKQRIPNIISQFFGKASIDICDSSSPVFCRLSSYIISTPYISFNQPIQFYAMLESCSPNKLNVETEWILELLSCSVVEPEDLHILERVGGLKACLSLYASDISTIPVRKYILILINNLIKHPNCTWTLINIYNIHAWILQVIIGDKTTNWETCFLSRIYYRICLNFKEYIKKEMEEENNDTKIDNEKVLFLSQSLKYVGPLILSKFEDSFKKQLITSKVGSSKTDNTTPEDLDILLKEDWSL
uniref:NopRA1 domain-containing protein n=1 Tax=Parastrongyloides trichosuri TaxID=131310 RepID=A0A0N4ZMW8_PARTI